MRCVCSGRELAGESLLKRFAGFLGWKRTSYWLMSSFILLVLVIVYAWWPLVVEYWAADDPAYPLWVQLDWLLLGIFALFNQSDLITDPGNHPQVINPLCLKEYL